MVGDHTVFILLEDVRTGAHGVRGLAADEGQVTLRETEGVVVIIIQGSVAIVVHRRNGDAQLIDSGCFELRAMHGHAVVAGLLDARDVRGALTGGNTLGIRIGLVAELCVDQVGDGAACGLGVDAAVGHIVAVLIDDRLEEISGGRICGEALKAPQRRALGDVGRTVVLAVIRDLLREGLARCPERIPVRLLLVLGPVGEIRVVRTRRNDHVAEQFHARTILRHALDRNSIERAAAVVGRIGQNVHVEDDVVDGHRRAVGEDDVVTDLDVVIHGAVVVLNDVGIRDAIIEVVLAVVINGLALDALQDQVACAVVADQADLRHGVRILVIGGLGEEGAELLGEGGITDDEGRGLFFRGGLGCRLSRCCIRGLGGRRSRLACNQSERHGERQHERQNFVQGLAHCFLFPPY